MTVFSCCFATANAPAIATAILTIWNIKRRSISTIDQGLDGQVIEPTTLELLYCAGRSRRACR